MELGSAFGDPCVCPPRSGSRDPSAQGAGRKLRKLSGQTLTLGPNVPPHPTPASPAPREAGGQARKPRAGAEAQRPLRRTLEGRRAWEDAVATVTGSPDKRGRVDCALEARRPVTAVRLPSSATCAQGDPLPHALQAPPGRRQWGAAWRARGTKQRRHADFFVAPVSAPPPAGLLSPV